MRSSISRILVCLAVGTSPLAAAAEPQPAPGVEQATSLDQLLEQVRTANERESAENQRRIETFTRDRAQQEHVDQRALDELAHASPWGPRPDLAQPDFQRSSTRVVPSSSTKISTA